MEILKTKIYDKEGNEYLYFPRFNILLPAEIEDTNIMFYHKVMNFLQKIIIPKPRKVAEEVKYKLANVRKLLLEISQDCNLRCRYCVYSGKFLDSRIHSPKLMSWEMAKDSIDFFFDWIIRNEKLRYYPYIFTIGFYGGEPLLNFEVIKNTVLYSRALVESRFKNAELNFSITTNGLLLDMNKIDFLVKNDFWLLISLDGPSEIHDKNKGRGSFEKLFETINFIYKEYPQYYNQKVGYSIVYAKDTDLKKVVEFFSQDIFEESFELNFAYVVTSYSTLKFPKYGVNEKLVIEEIKEKKRKGLKLGKIEEEVVNAYFHNVKLKNLMIKGEDENRSNCILGTKTLFVTPEGKFYGCEKTGESFKIGSLTNGYNFEIIRRIESEWRKKTGRKCKTCFVQAFCSACVATAGFKGRIILGKYCNERKKDFLEKVSEYIEYQKKG